MDDNEVIDILDSELRDAGGQLEVAVQLFDVKQAIGGSYWDVKKTVEKFGDLYELLDNRKRSIVSTERTELIDIHEYEKEKRKNLTTRIESVLGQGSEKILGENYSQEFVRRTVAKRNQHDRETVSGDLLSALDNLEQEIYSPSFDSSKAYKAISSGSQNWIRSYSAEFAWHLICKGWDTDDLEDLAGKIQKSDDSIPVRIKVYADQNRNSYRYLLTLPSVKLEVPTPRKLENENIAIYPADFLRVHDLFKKSELNSHQKEWIATMLSEDPCIAVSVEAYGRREGLKKAIAEASRVLDSFSYVHQQADLGPLEYAIPLKHIRWNRNLDSPPIHGMTTKGDFPAIIDEDRIEIAERVFKPANKEEDLSIRLSRGLDLFRQSNLSGPTARSIVNQVACMETLVARGDRKKDYVKDTLILLGEITDGDRHKIESDIDVLYDKRNSALHAGKTKIENKEVIKRSQNSVQRLISSIIARIAKYVDENPDSEISDLIQDARKEERRHRAIVGWKLYRDLIVTGKNYRLEGTFVDSADRPVADVQGSFRVENPGRHLVVVCNYRFSNVTSNTISSRDKVWLLGEVNGEHIKVGPVAGRHASPFFSNYSEISVRDYQKR